MTRCSRWSKPERRHYVAPRLKGPTAIQKARDRDRKTGIKDGQRVVQPLPETVILYGETVILYGETKADTEREQTSLELWKLKRGLRGQR